jgi:hypothetical protein
LEALFFLIAYLNLHDKILSSLSGAVSLSLTIYGLALFTFYGEIHMEISKDILEESFDSKALRAQFGISSLNLFGYLFLFEMYSSIDTMLFVFMVALLLISSTLESSSLVARFLMSKATERYSE